jgi:hypothetical protein
MKQYAIHVQGWAHSMTAYGANKRDAWDRFKKQHGIIRMPKGSAIWETN